MRAKIRIKSDSIHGRDTKVSIIDDNGNETSIPDIYELQLKMHGNEVNRAEIKLRAFVEIDAVAELVKAEVDDGS